MADPYTILGVPRSADEAAIKKSVSESSPRSFHPDRNTDNPKAGDRFSEVTNAYDLLSDKDKRAQFDRGEIDEQGKPQVRRFGYGGGGGANTYGPGGGRRRLSPRRRRRISRPAAAISATSSTICFGGRTAAAVAVEEASAILAQEQAEGRSGRAGGNARHVVPTSAYRPSGAVLKTPPR